MIACLQVVLQVVICVIVAIEVAANCIIISELEVASGN